MKNIIFIYCLIAFSLLAEKISAQAPPQKMTYQFVARNAQNQLIQNNVVGLRISILQGAPNGNAVYVETHTPQTNGNGTATIEVGGGTPVSGVFANIDWSTGVYFIQTEMDPQGQQGFSVTAVSQLLTVPYAFYAARSTRATFADSVAGGMNETDPNFTASVAAGITPADTARWNQDLVDDADSDPTNELQTLSVVGDTIFLSNGGFAIVPQSNNSFSHYIGEYYGGGVIFHLWKDNLGVEHGLIVSLTDQRTSQRWSNVIPFFSNATNVNGEINTLAIISQPGHTISAASVARAHNGGGFTDWYLPSRHELNLLYNNLFNVHTTLAQISGATLIQDYYYWSSTEEDGTSAGLFHFFYGDSFGSDKINTWSVRAIRNF
jgi:hypothetical protein